VAVAAFLLLAVLTFSLGTPPAAGELASVEHPVEDGRPLRLLVVGDWGRKGMYNQSRVAAQVCRYVLSCSITVSKNSTLICALFFLPRLRISETCNLIWGYISRWGRWRRT
jgi:hypothetical protein